MKSKNLSVVGICIFGTLSLAWLGLMVWLVIAGIQWLGRN